MNALFKSNKDEFEKLLKELAELRGYLSEELEDTLDRVVGALLKEYRLHFAPCLEEASCAGDDLVACEKHADGLEKERDELEEERADLESEKDNLEEERDDLLKKVEELKGNIDKQVQESIASLKKRLIEDTTNWGDE